MNNKKRVAMGYVFLLPALILFMVVVAYPVFNTLKTSFYSIRVQNIATGGKWVGLANYKQLIQDPNTWVTLKFTLLFTVVCNGVQREHNKKLNNGLPILHKVPPKRDYGRYFCIMAEKGGTSHGGLTEKLSPFFHAKKQEVNAYGR